MATFVHVEHIQYYLSFSDISLVFFNAIFLFRILFSHHRLFMSSTMDLWCVSSHLFVSVKKKEKVFEDVIGAKTVSFHDLHAGLMALLGLNGPLHPLCKSRFLHLYLVRRLGG